jgi:hypothetical protein
LTLQLVLLRGKSNTTPILWALLRGKSNTTPILWALLRGKSNTTPILWGIHVLTYILRNYKKANEPEL